MRAPAADELRGRLAAALGARYVLGAELGAGGMAHVFAATESTTGRRVAVKVLAPAVAACCDAERFRREMALVASLDHPHIVPLLAECDTCGGERLFYFVMPHVAAESLRARLDRSGALPVADAVRAMRDVAAALAHAHRRGIVHRDVKPGNVLLAAHGAVVTDFGVARALASAAAAGADGMGDARAVAAAGGAPSGATTEREHDEAGDLTRAGVAVGTPAYMAPEQALGDPAADHRVDLYALGVLAYEMLTGAPPFAAPSARAMIVAHLTEEPRPVDAVRGDVPRTLATLVARLLAKDPAERPRDAEAVLDALGALAPLAPR